MAAGICLIKILIYKAALSGDGLAKGEWQCGVVRSALDRRLNGREFVTR